MGVNGCICNASHASSPPATTHMTYVRKPPWGSLMATQRGSTVLVGSLIKKKCDSWERLPDMWTVRVHV